MAHVNLQYIETDGSQVINTGFTPDGNTTVSMDYEGLLTGVNQGLFCARDEVGNTNSYTLFMMNSNNFRYDLLGAAYTVDASVTGRKTITTTKTSIDIDGTVYNFSARSGTADNTMILFASWSSKTSYNNYATGRLYGFKIWDNGTLVRDFTPAMEDGVAGLYDEVNEVFYAPVAGTLIAGPYAIDNNSKLEYIEPNRNSVIDTGFVPNGNTTVEVDWTPTEFTTTQCLFCSRSQVSSTDSTAFVLFFTKASGYSDDYRFDHYGFSEGISPSDETARCLITSTKTSITIGDSSTTFPQSSAQSPLTLRLFASTSNSAGTEYGNYSYGRYHRIKIYDNGVLVRDFIPYYSNNVAGLRDNLTKTFYAPVVGTIIPGPSISSVNGKVNVNGEWKDISAMYVNDNGTWKEATAMYVNVDGTWKESV